MLDDYRRSFARAYEGIVRQIESKLNLTPTGRPAKSTTAIGEKLQRESVRLSQIQDIAGCRLVVPDVPSQDRAVRQLTDLFPDSTVVDRRLKPSFGYRAVHVIAMQDDKPIEIQVRTHVQHGWAELSEKFSDVVDPSIKYGGGSNKDILRLLNDLSDLIAQMERAELDIVSVFSNDQDILNKQQERMQEQRARLTRLLEQAIMNLDHRK